MSVVHWPQADRDQVTSLRAEVGDLERQVSVLQNQCHILQEQTRTLTTTNAVLRSKLVNIAETVAERSQHTSECPLRFTCRCGAGINVGRDLRRRQTGVEAMDAAGWSWDGDAGWTCPRCQAGGHGGA